MKRSGEDQDRPTLAKLKRATCGLTSNLSQWRRELSSHLNTSYGLMLNTITTGVNWAHPPITQANMDDLIPALDFGGVAIQWTDADRRKAIMQLTGEKQKLEAKYRALQPEMWAEIRSYISESSWTLIEADVNYAVHVANFDIAGLMTMVVSTHQGHLDANGAPNVRTKTTLREQFFDIRQQANESIHGFNNRINISLATCVAHNVDGIPAGESLVYHWLHRLDAKRHGEMVAQLVNNNQLPANISAALARAEAWTKPTTSKTGQILYVSSDLVLATAETKTKPTDKPKTSTEARACYNCGGPHLVKDCKLPPKNARMAESMKKFKANANLKKGGGEILVVDTSVSVDTPITMDPAPAAAAPKEDIDDSDYYLYTDADGNQGYKRFVGVTHEDELLLYCAGTVILDNGAAFSLVHDKSNYVTDQYPAANHSAVGISGSSLRLNTKGSFMNELDVYTSPKALVSILSQTELKDDGAAIQYDEAGDWYGVTTKKGTYMVFKREYMEDGKLSKHYLLQHHTDLVGVTINDNVAARTKGEVALAARARTFHETIGGSTAAAGKSAEGFANPQFGTRDLELADRIFGGRRTHSMGATKQTKPVQVTTDITTAGLTKEAQVLQVDTFTVDGENFIVGILCPSKFALTRHLRNGEADHVAARLHTMMQECDRRKVPVPEVQSDNDKAFLTTEVASMLKAHGSTMTNATPGQHCAEVERLGQTLKSDYRGRRATSPYGWGKAIIILMFNACVAMFNCRVSLQTVGAVAVTLNTDKQRVKMGDRGTVSGHCPAQWFYGRNPDAIKDFPAVPGSYCYITELPATNSNSTDRTRTRDGIYGYPTLDRDHAHTVLALDTMTVLTRPYAAIKINPTPQSIVTLLDDLADEDFKKFQTTLNLPPAHREYMEGVDKEEVVDTSVSFDTPTSMEPQAQRSGVPQQEAGVAPALPPAARRGREGRGDSLAKLPSTSTPFDAGKYVTWSNIQDDLRAAELLTILKPMGQWRDADFVLKIAVKKAMKTREVEATAAITKELKQMIDMRVWRPVRMASLPLSDRYNFIRSQCFLKDKYTAAGVFEKLKARLVGRGDMQDKTLYDDLSSPTVATTSVLITVAIAAFEKRHMMSLDVPGAFLNADMKATGVTVRMLLDPTMTAILVKMDPTYGQYVNDNGTCLVELDKALYGTVEAAKLWYDMITGVLLGEGFVANPYDRCVLNKVGQHGHQVTICLHVDDLLVTCEDRNELDAVQRFLADRFGDVTVHRGGVINYVGMTFDLASRPGICEVTMNGMTDDLVASSGVTRARATPAADNLFEVRDDADRLVGNDEVFFRTYTMKLLYLAKRVRPECLTAVAFLTTRTQACDSDDMGKLHRVIGYLYGCPHRGIALDIGSEGPNVRSYIDAAYGVHTRSGKSHTGSVIVLGNQGPVYVSSSKQKIVTKSSTEAELVGLSDAATQALHTRHFIEAQGYATAPLTIYQDNMSCMSLIKRGGPCSQRSRHISIRRFWLKERVDGGEVVIRHMATGDMVANILTKPVQGMQFLKERQGLTNWDR